MLVNAGKWTEAAELFAPNVRHHLGSWQDGEERIVQGRETLTRNFEDIFRTFPDWKMEIVDMVVEGDNVVVRCRVSGTHRGISTTRVNGGFLLGVAPTGKHFVVQHIHWYKLQGGLIGDHFTNRDDAGMARQLGLLP
jgi:predicted ester cyclase